MPRTATARKTTSKPHATAPAVATTATARFVRVGDTHVDEPGRKLMWTHTLGERNFAGAQKLIDQINAKKHGGYADWRLPTVEELFCLADRTKSEPAIDTDAFPDTPKWGWYWSSTPYAPLSGFAWGVYFHNGLSVDLFHGGRRYGYVRAVRPSQ